ncbi:MAG: aldo/keto reductase [Actinomycetaceae bacterium]|nr:aldo/keto reductase [Actinomycetaceae bacterium]
MDYRKIGSSGLRVSTIGLGTLTWGRDTDEVDAAACYEAYRQAGGNFIDTSPTYGDGRAETVLAPLIAEDDAIIATKVGVWQGRRDCSRRAILASHERSRANLRRKRIDLTLVSSWDDDVPISETLGALHYLVEGGFTDYVGWCNLPAWQLAHVKTLANAMDLPLIALETEYSLLNRSIEREGQNACAHLGVGILGWAPLGRGVLTGKYRHATPPDSRGASVHLAGYVSPYLERKYAGTVEAVQAAADGLERFAGEVALAWVRDRAEVATVITGARTSAQLKQVLAADSLTIPRQVAGALDDVSNHLI